MEFGRKSAPPVNATAGESLSAALEEHHIRQRSVCRLLFHLCVHELRVLVWFQVSRTPQPYVEAAKAQNNYLFGMKMWVPTQKQETTDLQRQLNEPVERPPPKRNRLRNRFSSLGNIFYTFFFGWWLALAYVACFGLSDMATMYSPHIM